MSIQLTETAQEQLNKLQPDFADLAETDPEFYERFCNFAFDQVVVDGAADGEPLDDRTRYMAVLATLLGCQGDEAFFEMLPAALNAGLEPVAVREIVYQATAYLGFGRVAPFFGAMNAVFENQGIELPLPDKAGTEPTYESRVEAGEAKQVEFFGEGMKGFANNGNPEYPQVNRWLASHCFGDWYTRGGLTGNEREMITFCFLAAQGGAEPQLTSHARANMNIGNTKAFLAKIVSANVPYIGYPRSLNALRCVEEAAKA